MAAMTLRVEINPRLGNLEGMKHFVQRRGHGINAYKTLKKVLSKPECVAEAF